MVTAIALFFLSANYVDCLRKTSLYWKNFL